MTLRVYPHVEGRSVGEILDAQHPVYLEARQKEKAIEVIVPQGIVNPLVELPTGVAGSEVVIKHK